MNKLFIIDVVLILLTLFGGLYINTLEQYSSVFLVMVFLIYILSKIIGYFILPYEDFQKFINQLTEFSKVGKISGFEIFKGALVLLLYIGFLTLHPGIWIIESVLVVLMRVWGKMSKMKQSITKEQKEALCI